LEVNNALLLNMLTQIDYC